MARDDPAAEGAPNARPMVSVVVTVRNEGKHLADLLDSLVTQEPPFEVVVVDSASTDDTLVIAERYAKEHGVVRVLEHPGTRGESRNFGVAQATGDVVAFIDGDCIANPFWLRELRKGLAGHVVAAGRTIQIGYWAFESLHRVELEHRGYDVTFPSCNLAYDRSLFEKLGGFDARFHTAEDIDLNWRAVEAGASIAYRPEAIVYHRARESIASFLKQAYWNGYGRKQLTLKHGALWNRYSFRRMLQQQFHFWGLLRLAGAMWGYVMAKLREDREAYR